MCKTYKKVDDKLIISLSNADFNEGIIQLKKLNKLYPGHCSFIYSIKKWSLSFKMIPFLEEMGFREEGNTPIIVTPPPKGNELKLNQKILDLIPYTPYQHQLDGAKFILINNNGIIALEPGMGKSLIALIAYAHTQHKLPLLIICPASLKTHWYREVRKTLNIRAKILYGKIDKLPNNEVIIANYDILYRNRLKLAGMFDAVIFDEAHYLAHESQRTQAAKLIQSCVKTKIFLTGTPADRPSNMWNMLNMIDPFTWKDKVAFLKRYCTTRMIQGRMTYGANQKTLLELYDKMKPIMFKRTPEECGIDMPERVNILVEVDVENEDIIEENKRIVSELDEVDDIEDIEEELKERIEALSRSCFDTRLDSFFEIVDDLIDEVGKIVISYHHTAVGELIAHRYKAKRIAGGVKVNTRQEIVDSFESDPEQKVLVLQDVAGGEGFSIYSTHYMVFAEIPITMRSLIQMSGRIRRIQTTAPQCFYYFVKSVIEGSKSMDEKILELLKRRSLTMTTMIDGKATNFIEMVETIKVREE